MKENESVISARGHDRQESKIEDKSVNPLYGAIAWTGISAATLLMAWALPKHEGEVVYRDDNVDQPKIERRIVPPAHLADLLLEKKERLPDTAETQNPPAQSDLENEFKTKNRLLENNQFSSSEVLDIVENNPEVFSKQDTADIEMYYPIYKAAGDKFNVDWYLLWVVHKKESTVSRNPRAFDGSSGFIGAMQRSPYFYPEEAVNEASKGLENLAELPQRHPTDWREIAFASWKISRDRDGYQKRGMSQPLLLALEAYGDDYEAYRRWQAYNNLKTIFG